MSQEAQSMPSRSRDSIGLEDEALSVSVQLVLMHLLLSSICDTSRPLKPGRWSIIKKNYTRVRIVVRG